MTPITVPFDVFSLPPYEQAPGDVADSHFGTDEEMLAWCEKEGLTPVKDKRGRWDWLTVWDKHSKRFDAGPPDEMSAP